MVRRRPGILYITTDEQRFGCLGWYPKLLHQVDGVRLRLLNRSMRDQGAYRKEGRWLFPSFLTYQVVPP